VRGITIFGPCQGGPYFGKILALGLYLALKTLGKFFLVYLEGTLCCVKPLSERIIEIELAIDFVS
jgi:hypothetical protein